jgi:hypothetical protein
MTRFSTLLCRPGRRVALGLLAAAVLGLLWYEIRPGYTETVIERLPSPDGAWIVVNNERISDADSSAETEIVDWIRLISTKSPYKEIDLFQVDTGGNVSERPHIVWFSPNILQITLPLADYLRADYSRRYNRLVQGIYLDIRFDPDSPVVREICGQPGASPPEPADDAVKR